MAGALPPQCQRDVDSLRAFVRRAIGDGMPAAAVPVANVREVLLTGATGFVGRFVLRDLLRQDADLVVHCLVRAADGEHGLQRLRAALEEAEIWDEAFAARIHVVAGDIGEARFGLSRSAFDDLARRIDAVHHFAADVSLSASYLAIRKTNAFSMRNVLELCLHTRRKHLFYALDDGGVPAVLLRLRQRVRRRRHRPSGATGPRPHEVNVPAGGGRVSVEQAGRRAERAVRVPGRCAGGGSAPAADRPG